MLDSWLTLKIGTRKNNYLYGIIVGEDIKLITILFKQELSRLPKFILQIFLLSDIE